MVGKVIIQSKFVNFTKTVAVRVLYVSPECRTSIRNTQTKASKVSTDEKISIPLRIKRDELSILKALASTVKGDSKSPNFKFIDDPNLIPGSNTDKRTYSLAKVSGQKAARFVVEKYPGNFVNDPAQPPIKLFMPPEGLKFADDTVDGLRERIVARKSLESFESYQKLLQLGVDIPVEDLENLLDLQCFYNSEVPVEALLPDELFFFRDMNPDSSKRKRKDWKDDGAAEVIYKGMVEPSIRASCSMIRGRAKFYNGERAYELYKELRQKNAKVDVKTYNALLDVSFYLRENAETRWALIQELMKDMAEANVQPDIDTFNAVLSVLTRCSKFHRVSSWSKLVLNEMKNCNIEPTLTTWTHMLHLNYSFSDSSSPVLYRIIEHLEGKKLHLNEPSDYDFFSSAMAICFNYLKDLQLCYKIKALLDVDNNRQLLGDSFRQGIFYSYYLRLLCMCEQLDNIMLQYDKLVPHVYTPTFSVLNELLTALELNEGYHHLPRIWTDLIVFKYTRRSDLIEQLVSIMARKKQDQQLQEHYVKIAQNIQVIYESDSKDRKMGASLVLTGSMVGNLAQIHLYADDFPRAWELVQFYKRDERKISGFPSEQSLVSMINACMEQQDAEKTLEVLSMMSNFGYPKMEELASKVEETMSLTDHQRSHLADLSR